ncbi:hypothetical protein HF319_09350 [Xanthomonas sp. Kuri4-1]
MKTPYEVKQELERLERLVPHIISDQGDRAEEILGFHVASLLGNAAPREQTLIRERTASLTRACRQAQERAIAAARASTPALQPQLA